MIVMRNQWHVKGANTASEAAQTGKTHLIYHVTVSCTAAATIQIKSGTNVLVEIDLVAGVTDIDYSGAPILCNLSEAATVAASAGSAKINFTGITV